MPPSPPGPVRCPKCRQLALPMQSHCLGCNARLPKERPEEAPRGADGECPGCGRELPAEAVFCIDCGYDRRTGHKRETVRGEAAESEPRAPTAKRSREPLPPGFAKVRLGLGFHCARLALTLPAVLLMVAVLCYAENAGPAPDIRVISVGMLIAAGAFLLAALFGMIGSVLCLWVGRASRAWGLIFVSLLLDVATPPLAVALQAAEWPALFGWVVAFVAWLFFMLFLRRLARHLDRLGEANEIMALITRGVGLLVGVPLFLILLAQIAFLTALATPAAVTLFIVVSTLILILQIVLLSLLVLSILGVIGALREAIAKRLPRRGKSKRPEILPDEE